MYEDPMKKKQAEDYDYWKNGPKSLQAIMPLNPHFDPNAAKRSKEVTASMEADDFYSNHTREECKEEWARRYEALK